MIAPTGRPGGPPGPPGSTSGRPRPGRSAIRGISAWHRLPTAAPRRRRLDDSGTSIVEAVIVVPVVMFLLLVAVQCALWMHAAQVVQLAASEGDRTGRSMGGGQQAGIASARAVVDGPGSDVVGAQVTTSVLPGDALWLRVSGRATSVLPGLSFAVSASAVGPIQEFRSTP